LGGRNPHISTSGEEERRGKGQRRQVFYSRRGRSGYGELMVVSGWRKGYRPSPAERGAAQFGGRVRRRRERE